MFNHSITCDGCGTLKRETNHWIGIRLTKDCGQIFLRLEIRAFDDATVNDGHYCGEACALKSVSSFISRLFAEQAELAAEMAK